LRILLDENLDWRLERRLLGHEVESVPLIGWAGVENGELLERAQNRFDILITMDSKMVRELNIQDSKLAVIVLKAPSNMLSDTFPLMPRVLAQLPTAKAGTVIFISA
jgi:predicted nuclease of predicted toxin-antitoxin system